MKKDAIFSGCKKYRYVLWRIWDEAKPYAMFIGLNPSTADETNDDPTVSRCIKYSQKWGYGGLCMTNLFAYRATEPAEMKSFHEPIGCGNDEWLLEVAKKAGIIIAAWGNHGSHLSRSNEVLQLIPNVYCLKLNKSGEPAHPLYHGSTLKPQQIAV